MVFASARVGVGVCLIAEDEHFGMANDDIIISDCLYRISMVLALLRSALGLFSIALWES